MSKKTALVISLLVGCAVLIILEQSGKFSKVESRKRPFVIYEPSFKEVNSFSRPVIFLGLSIHPKNEEIMFAQLNYLKDGMLFPGPTIDKEPKKNHFEAGIIGVRPDGKSFFVSVLDELVELDSDLKIKRRIPIEEFKIESYGSELVFTGHGEASNSFLWFGIDQIPDDKGLHTYFLPWCLAEWDTSKPSANRLLGNAQAHQEITVDETNRKVFTFNEIFNFKTMENEEVPYRGFEFVDFDPNYGLLASKTETRTGEKNFIVKFDFATGDKKIIAEGLGAVWGLEGYVYYCDTKKQLWRCSADGNDPIQFSSGVVKNINIAASTYNSIIQPPKISHDRTLLAYNYSYYGVGVITGGTALIDLKTHEYLILENEIFSYNQMAWLIKKQ